MCTISSTQLNSFRPAFYLCYNRGMRRRIFIAINLPEKVKKRLVSFQKSWSLLPVRWVKEENLHLTLAFLGYLDDEELVRVCQTIKEMTSRNSPFFIKLVKIDYGVKQKGIPRLIWAEGEPSRELDLFKEDLDRTLAEAIGFVPEKRKFLPHITLGRIRKWDWQRIEPEERPDISEDFSLEFEVRSVEVMESRLKRGGAEYSIMESEELLKK